MSVFRQAVTEVFNCLPALARWFFSLRPLLVTEVAQVVLAAQ